MGAGFGLSRGRGGGAVDYLMITHEDGLGRQVIGTVAIPDVIVVAVLLGEEHRGEFGNNSAQGEYLCELAIESVTAF